MNIKTYRAKTMQQALELVRRELGPDAAVLHTRELNSGLVRRMVFGRQYEVAASGNVNVPSRLPELLQASAVPAAAGLYEAGPVLQMPATNYSHQMAGQLDRLQE